MSECCRCKAYVRSMFAAYCDRCWESSMNILLASRESHCCGKRCSGHTDNCRCHCALCVAVDMRRLGIRPPQIDDDAKRGAP